MRFYGRAFISIKRNMRRSIILFLLILVLGCMISGTLLINLAIENIRQSIFTDMRPYVVIGLDWATINEYNAEREATGNLVYSAEPQALTTELIREIGTLPYVKSYEYTVTDNFFSPSLTKYRACVRYYLRGNLGFQFEFRGESQPYFNALGQGLIEIVAGRTFTDEEMNHFSMVALISEQFAQVNKLIVGSVMPFKKVIFDPTKVVWPRDMNERYILASESYDVEVVGIYRVNMDDLLENRTPRTFDSIHRLEPMLANKIYVPSNFVEAANQFSVRVSADIHLETDCENLNEMEAINLSFAHRVFRENQRMHLEPFIVLYSPRDILPFQEDVQEMLPKFYMTGIEANNFQETMLALDTMRSLAMFILYMIVGAMIIVLSLLIFLFLRERKQEIGIYLSLGESKRRIILQMIVEVVFIAVIALANALLLGNILAGYLGEYILLQDILAELEYDKYVFHNPAFRRGLLSDVTAYAIERNYDVSISFQAVLIFLGVGIGTTLLATLLPVIYIARLNPKKIMM